MWYEILLTQVMACLLILVFPQNNLECKWFISAQFKSLSLESYSSNFKCLILQHILMIGILGITSTIAIRWHWFRWGLGTVRQQAITWTNIDSNLCCHVALLQHDERKSCIVLTTFYVSFVCVIDIILRFKIDVEEAFTSYRMYS